jgi:hypothetical protein
MKKSIKGGANVNEKERWQMGRSQIWRRQIA